MASSIRISYPLQPQSRVVAGQRFGDLVQRDGGDVLAPLQQPRGDVLGCRSRRSEQAVPAGTRDGRSRVALLVESFDVADGAGQRSRRGRGKTSSRLSGGMSWAEAPVTRRRFGSGAGARCVGSGQGDPRSGGSGMAGVPAGLVAAGGLIGGYGVARWTKRRPLGGVALAAAGAVAAKGWRDKAGNGTAAALSAGCTWPRSPDRIRWRRKSGRGRQSSGSPVGSPPLRGCLPIGAGRRGARLCADGRRRGGALERCGQSAVEARTGHRPDTELQRGRQGPPRVGPVHDHGVLGGHLHRLIRRPVTAFGIPAPQHRGRVTAPLEVTEGQSLGRVDQFRRFPQPFS